MGLGGGAGAGSSFVVALRGVVPQGRASQATKKSGGGGGALGRKAAAGTPQRTHGTNAPRKLQSGPGIKKPSTKKGSSGMVKKPHRYKWVSDGFAVCVAQSGQRSALTTLHPLQAGHCCAPRDLQVPKVYQQPHSARSVSDPIQCARFRCAQASRPVSLRRVRADATCAPPPVPLVQLPAPRARDRLGIHVGGRFQGSAILALRNALEARMVEDFVLANLFAIHAGRVTISKPQLEPNRQSEL